MIKKAIMNARHSEIQTLKNMDCYSYLNFRYIDSLFQDTERTIPVTSHDQKVGSVNDLISPHHFVSDASVSRRPTYKDNGCLYFDGNDWLESRAAEYFYSRMNNSNGVHVYCVYKISPSSTYAIIFDTSNAYGPNAGARLMQKLSYVPDGTRLIINTEYNNSAGIDVRHPNEAPYGQKHIYDYSYLYRDAVGRVNNGGDITSTRSGASKNNVPHLPLCFFANSQLHSGGGVGELYAFAVFNRKLKPREQDKVFKILTKTSEV